MLALAAATGATPASAAACTSTAPTTTNLGSFSPAAVGAGAAPALRSRAGLVCAPGLLKLLSGNYIKATFQSRNALKLLPPSATTPALPYTLSADTNGAVPSATAGQANAIRFRPRGRVPAGATLDFTFPVAVRQGQNRSS